MWGLPNVIGAIDCTHINIECPDVSHAGDYFDRKRSYSIQIQAVVDSHMKYLDIVAGWPGSVHDSRIYSLSKMHLRRPEVFNGPAVFVNGFQVSEYLIGDGGYPLNVNMMIPIPGRKANLSVEENGYNFKHCSTRMCVEKSFGRLKSIFRILRNVFERPDMNKLPHVVVACAILHNIYLQLYETADVTIEPDYELAAHSCAPSSRVPTATAAYTRAKNVRKHLMYYLHTLPDVGRGNY